MVSRGCRNLGGFLLLALLTLHVLAPVAVQAASVAGQASNGTDTGSGGNTGGALEQRVSSLVNELEGVPVLGELVRLFVRIAKDFWRNVEDLIDGVFERLFGCSLINTPGLNHSVACELRELSDGITSALPLIIGFAPIPHFVKTVLIEIVNSLSDPIINTVFAGLAAVASEELPGFVSPCSEIVCR